jgi:hypothetical protein
LGIKVDGDEEKEEECMRNFETINLISHKLGGIDEKKLVLCRNILF